MDEGEAADIIYLDFSKVFDTISHTILLEKLAAHGLDVYLEPFSSVHGKGEEHTLLVFFSNGISMVAYSLFSF